MGNEFAALVGYLKDDSIERCLQRLVGTVVHRILHHLVDMRCKEVVEFINEIEVGCVLIFVLVSNHEVHLLQLVVELSTLHRNMTTLTLLQELVHQIQILRPQAAQYISRTCLDILIVCLHDASLIGLAREAHPHHPKPFPQVLDDVIVQQFSKADTEIRGVTINGYHQVNVNFKDSLVYFRFSSYLSIAQVSCTVTEDGRILTSLKMLS